MTNIKTISKIDKAVALFSGVINAKVNHEESVKLLGLDPSDFEFQYSGFSLDKWLNDFKNICGQLNIKAMLADLQDDENTLNKLVSKDKREELELLALEAKLKKK